MACPSLNGLLHLKIRAVEITCIQQSFSAFLNLGLFSIMPHVVVTPQTIKLFLLLLHTCDFAAVVSGNEMSVLSNGLRRHSRRVIQPTG